VSESDGSWMRTCSILTTTPNAVTAGVHDRMPAILDPGAYELWLDPGINDVGAASEPLMPFDARLKRCYPVSSLINYMVKDDAECSRPVELVQIQSGLFS
jgi:putative SOS response-associated peptidase YedK